jgi:hypothetical protein
LDRLDVAPERHRNANLATEVEVHRGGSDLVWVIERLDP